MYAITLRSTQARWFTPDKNVSFVDEYRNLQYTNLYKENSIHNETKYNSLHWYCDGTVAIDQNTSCDGVEHLVIVSLCANNLNEFKKILEYESKTHEELRPLIETVISAINDKDYFLYPYSPEEYFSFEQRKRCSKCQSSTNLYR